MAAFTRKGTHRLSCECGAYVYAAVAMLERHGIPSCACGQRFTPERRELALLLGVSCHAITEYESARASGLTPAEAATAVERARTIRARARRLAPMGAGSL